MSLYNKASIVLAPGAYKEGRIYNQKPLSYTSDLKFDRGTNATEVTRVNSDSIIKESMLLGDEVLVNGDFSSDSNWNKDGNVTITGGNANFIEFESFIQQSITNPSSYRVTLNVSSVTTSGTLRIRANNFLEIATITIDSTGEYIIDNPLTSNDGLVLQAYGFLGSISSVSVKPILRNIPRINYLGDSEGYLLVEGQSTNVLTYSNNFNQNIYTELSVPQPALNSITSPTGDLTGATLSSGTDESRLIGLRVETPVVLGEKWTFSYFAKKKDSDWTGIIFNADQDGWKPDGAQAWFNINNGTLGNITSGSGVEFTAKIEDYGNGWYRCSATCTATADSSRGQVMILLTNANGATQMDLGDGTYIFGAQFEKQPFATSYIPTNGGQATRAEEIANDAVGQTLFGQTEGVLYVEMAALTDEPYENVPKSISINDNSDDNSIKIYYHPGIANQVVPRVHAGTLDWAKGTNINTAYSRTNSQFNKFAIKYSSSGIKFFFNGVLAQETNTVPNFTNTLHRLSLADGDPVVGPHDGSFQGKIKCITVFKEALTDTELENLTSISTDQILEEYRTHVEGLNGFYENESTMRSTLNGFI